MEPKFITVFTRARHWTLSWVRWLHSTSSHLVFKIRFVSILHLCQCFPSGHLRRHVWLGLCMHFLYPPCVLHAPSISSSFIWSPYLYLEYTVRADGNSKKHSTYRPSCLYFCVLLITDTCKNGFSTHSGEKKLSYLHSTLPRSGVYTHENMVILNAYSLPAF